MIYLKDYINFSQVCSELRQKLSSSISCIQIKQGFVAFFWSDERSDFWYYTKEQCQEIVEEIVAEFLEDVSGVPQETFAGRVAKETGLELINEPSEIYPCSWLEVA